MSVDFPGSLIPDNESERLRTLHLYQIVNTTPELIFDNYVTWAALLFNTPVALISLVDEEYVYFKAATGTEEVMALPRSASMCSAAILLDEEVFVSDYKAESCLLIEPYVAQAKGLNFYAGAALQMPNGARIGMLAVIGREPRMVAAVESSILSSLAALIVRTIELRFGYLRARNSEGWEAAQKELVENLDENATLARYLSSRSEGIHLDDNEVLELVQRRLTSIEKVLERRARQIQR